jgi:MFS transporter, OFA family, oxalate/formate antiporter
MLDQAGDEVGRGRAFDEPAGAIRSNVLAGSLVLSAALGSLHSFSVLLEPLERALAAARTQVAAGYSVAIVCATIGVLLCPVAQRRMGPRAIALAAGGVASAGLLWASLVLNPLAVLLGFGVLFGLGNGVGYALVLVQAAHAVPRSAGFAMGLAAASYSIGAALSSLALGAIANSAGAAVALAAQAGMIASAAVVAAWLFPALTRRQMPSPRDEIPRMPRARLVTIWFVFFFGATGGLMLIAHAAAVMTNRGVGLSWALAAPAVIAIGTVAGSVGGGKWADLASPRAALAWPVIGMAGALLSLAAGPLAVASDLALLAMVGGAYGALIAVVPAVLRDAGGPGGFARTFGPVFTAWGVAGLLGPLLGGLAFDSGGSYGPAILGAAACALAAAGLCSLLPASRGAP